MAVQRTACWIVDLTRHEFRLACRGALTSSRAPSVVRTLRGHRGANCTGGVDVRGPDFQMSLRDLNSDADRARRLRRTDDERRSRALHRRRYAPPHQRDRAGRRSVRTEAMLADHHVRADLQGSRSHARRHRRLDVAHEPRPREAALRPERKGREPLGARARRAHLTGDGAATERSRHVLGGGLLGAVQATRRAATGRHRGSIPTGRTTSPGVARARRVTASRRARRSRRASSKPGSRQVRGSVRRIA